MLEGEAVVTVHDTEIGRIKDEEVFGEISFLTGATRTASVKTVTKCLVQVIKGEDFEHFTKHRPSLIFKLSKTLAQRLTDVNRKLVAITTMT